MSRFAGIHRLVLPAFLIAPAAILYIPLCRYPFVQDDWTVLRSLTFQPSWDFLRDSLNPAGKIFYRPLASLYFAAGNAVFGLNPAGFHLVSLVLLIAASFLVVDIGRRLTGDRVLGWGAGFLFMAAANIHCDAQMWMVGMYDLGSVLFSLASVSLLLRKRPGLSALCLALAVGFKEAAAPLPFVLIAVFILTEEPGVRRNGVIGNVWANLRFHAGVAAVYAIMKSTGISIFTLPASHPYAARLTGERLTENAQLFAFWGLEGLLPVKNLVFSHQGVQIFLGVSTLFMVTAYFAALRHGMKTGGGLARVSRSVLCVIVWLAIIITPPLVLGNNPNKYYLLHALPPAAIGLMFVMNGVLRPLTSSRPVIAAAVVFFVLANFIDGVLLIQRKVALGAREGIHSVQWEGENHLIRKASVVRAVQEPLLKLLPSLPRNALILMQGVDTRSFDESTGPQVWYRDSTLQVAALAADARIIDGKIRASLPAAGFVGDSLVPGVAEISLERVFCVRLEDGVLTRIAVEEIVQRAGVPE